MRVLIVEDLGMPRSFARDRLVEAGGHEVVQAKDPLVVDPAAKYDVVFIDLLYEDLVRAFDARVRAGLVSLDDPTYLISGLHTLSRLEHPGNAVIWTTGEAVRSLHIVLAHQDFHARVYCSKGTGDSSGMAELARAMTAAAEGREWIDPHLACYLPRRGMPAIGSLLFSSPRRARIWRAMALGASTYRSIAAATSYSWRTVRNEITGTMITNLAEVDPGIEDSANPLTVLSGYATSNRAFFLDDTVVRTYPHGRT